MAMVSHVTTLPGFTARTKPGHHAMPHGDILGFAPPLVVSESEIVEIVEIAYDATRQVMDELAREGMSART
jgi:adenosylmethionine-8-amino-7-oxononanoate aminotransferase